MDPTPFIITGIIIALPISFLWYILWTKVLALEMRIHDLEVKEQLDEA